MEEGKVGQSLHGGAWREKKELHSQFAVNLKLRDTFAHMQKIYKYLCKKQRRHNQRGETWRHVEIRFLLPLPWGDTQEPRPPRAQAQVLTPAWTPASERLKAVRVLSRLSQAKSVHPKKKDKKNI